ncbi:histidine kinase [Caballeronia mineralivorans]|uniref:sensor histidine kinase n=1 Tax=Caballeronia mineralivorans TaxID=2010198 RepID=UPI0023F0B799|nr:histidine kinase [Caballeronia mineralivorans]MDB5783121.1 Autolysin sensor kinase [Caballeronia mineralivorans]
MKLLDKFTAHRMPHSQEILKRLWLELRIFVPVSMASALFYYSMYSDSFATNLIYSLCSTLFIQGLIEIGRYSLAYRMRKRSPDNLDAQRNWPGWALMIPWIVVSGVVGSVAGRELGDLLTGVHRAPATITENPRALLLSMTGVFVLSLGITYFFYARGRMAAMQTRAEAAMRSAAESQLKLLESQLEPHMLFNTLANLRVLIAQDPPRAQAMLDRLIAFLRATLDASRSGSGSGSHSLSAEFARIGDYLELMQTRMGARLNRRLDLPDELAGLPVPPLLLQPLVENAIKHGLEPTVAGGWIRVSAQREGGTLVLSVRDTGAGIGRGGAGPGGLPPGGSRFGIQQVRERLAALYGKTASLELIAASDDEGGTLAIVRLPVS